MYGKRNGREVCPFSIIFGDVTVMSLTTCLMVSFSICNRTAAPHHLRPQHLASHPQNVFKEFSKKDSE